MILFSEDEVVDKIRIIITKNINKFLVNLTMSDFVGIQNEVVEVAVEENSGFRVAGIRPCRRDIWLLCVVAMSWVFIVIVR